jgi:hypothetical protein
MAGTYSSEQTGVSFSLAADLGSVITGSVDEIEKTLAGKITTLLERFEAELGPWQLVWGPAVFQSKIPPSVRADNTMFVVKDNSDSTRYIIAIAGTNPYSVFDWLVEDVFVGKQVPWEFGSPPDDLQPALAEGTHIGLSNLELLQPGPEVPGDSKKLQQFLQSLPAGTLNITTVGHSLGGALAPVVGLWLSDTQTEWDPDSRATISCLAAAGPTPGNQDFATYYANSPMGKRTVRIHNQLDVVPHAWAKNDLAQVPTLYQPSIPPDFLIQALVALAKQISASGQYIQIDDSPALPGTVNKDIIISQNSFQSFVAQVPFQHVDAYYTLMGIEIMQEPLDLVREAAPTLDPAGMATALEAKLRRRIQMGILSGHPLL